MNRIRLALAAALMGLLMVAPARAAVVQFDPAQNTIKCGSGCAAPVPFTPTGAATLAVTTSSARVALPSADTTVLIENTGTTDATFKLGTVSVTAATTDFQLTAGHSIVVLAGAGQVDLAAITAAGSTTFKVTTGTGTPTIAGGGGGGTGGGAATIADGADVTQGALADAACGTDTGTCSAQALEKRLIQRITSLLTALGAPLQAAVALPAGEAHAMEVGGHTAIVGATFTTTATTTALADGQLLSNNATAGSVTPLDFAGVCRINQGTGMVRRARMKIADTGLAGKAVYLKLYRDSPTVTNGDHGAWLSSESNYIGQIQITFDQHFSDPLEKGVGAPDQGSEINFDCASASTHLYGLVVSSGASGTLQGSKVLTAVLEVLDN